MGGGTDSPEGAHGTAHAEEGSDGHAVDGVAAEREGGDGSPANGKSSKGDAAPSLRQAKPEELADFLKDMGKKAHRKDENIQSTPSEMAVPGAQQSWGNIWKNLHNSPGHQHRHRLEKRLQNYFQDATWKLSHHVPLLQGEPMSRSH